MFRRILAYWFVQLYVIDLSRTTKSLKMKRNRSLNTTNCLLSKMESTYVTTCFGLHLWPSWGYNLVALRANELSQPEFTPHHRTKAIHTTSFLHQKIATRYATTVLHHFSIHLSKPGQHSTHTVLHTMYTRFIRLDCSFSDDWDFIINLPLSILYKTLNGTRL
jgi:hypothetical protein